LKGLIVPSSVKIFILFSADSSSSWQDLISEIPFSNFLRDS